MISNKYVALFVVGFFVYIALMILIAYLTSRKGSTKGEDYLMGGRNVGLLLLICTAAATAVGTGTSVGATANGFHDGWARSTRWKRNRSDHGCILFFACA